VAVYNHLDIKIKVHPTLKSDYFGSTKPNTIVVNIPGSGPTKIEMPEQELRIVGFEVTPYSVANAWACQEGVDFNKVGPSYLEAD
jgi:hypothetical protein